VLDTQGWNTEFGLMNHPAGGSSSPTPANLGASLKIDYTLDKQTQNWCQQVLLRVGTPGEYLERLLQFDRR
jgi:hypothetical protein